MLYDFSKQNKRPADPNASGFAAPGKMSVAGALARQNASGGAMSPGRSVADAIGGANASGFATPGKMSVGEAATASRPLSANYRAPDKSRAAALAWNTEQARNAQQNQLLGQLNQTAASAQRAAQVNAAKRGLMSGGSAADSGIYQGMLRDIDRQRTGAMMTGFNEIDLNLSNRQQDYDLRRAGLEDTYNLGLQTQANALARQPYEVQGLMLGNQAQDINNQIGALGLDQRRRLFETTIAQAMAEGRITEAEAQAAQQMQARNEAWWNQPWAKDILRVGLVGAGIGGGFLLGGPAGALAGGGLGANVASGIR